MLSKSSLTLATSLAGKSSRQLTSWRKNEILLIIDRPGRHRSIQHPEKCIGVTVTKNITHFVRFHRVRSLRLGRQSEFHFQQIHFREKIAGRREGFLKGNDLALEILQSSNAAIFSRENNRPVFVLSG